MKTIQYALCIPIQQTEWYRSQPRCVQKRIDAYPPDRMYRLKSTGHIVPIHAYPHKGTVCSECVVLLLKVNNFTKVAKDTKVSVTFDDLQMLPEDLKRMT